MVLTTASTDRRLAMPSVGPSSAPHLPSSSSSSSSLGSSSQQDTIFTDRHNERCDASARDPADSSSLRLPSLSLISFSSSASF